MEDGIDFGGEEGYWVWFLVGGGGGGGGGVVSFWWYYFVNDGDIDVGFFLNGVVLKDMVDIFVVVGLGLCVFFELGFIVGEFNSLVDCVLDCLDYGFELGMD